jgi:hypothetical protein
MDDLQFRRCIYADPKTKDQGVNQAKASDPAKKKFAAAVDQLDDQIAMALQVDVPDDLYNTLILRQTLASHQQQKRKKRIHLAFAASFALAAGLTFNMLQGTDPRSNVGDIALAHMHHEQGFFHNQDTSRVSLTALNTMMADFNGNFAQSLGQLISAQFCPLNKMKSLHLVFQGQSSPVNVIILPRDGQLEFSSHFKDNQFTGQAKQYQGNNVIVIGDKNEPLQLWQEKIGNNITWSI